MDSPAFQRSFFLLACLAMLLMVAAPVVSRWLAHPPSHAVAAPADPHAAHHAGHHAAAAPAVPPPTAMAHHGHGDHPEHHVPAPAPKDPHADHDMGVDCEYCLIAARMLALLVALLLALLAWAPRRPTFPWQAPRTTLRAFGHLGARGPPLPA